MKSRDRTKQRAVRPTPAAKAVADRLPTLRPVPASIRAVFFGLLTLPALPTWALGLGELTVESRLGQPFSARTLIRTASDETVEAGCVTVLSGASASGLPGIPRARVEVEPRDGDYVLRIRTQRPVLEPAVSLVLAADCPGAAPVRREYTVLIDPPDAVWAARLPAQAAAPTASPRVRPPPVPAQTPAAAAAPSPRPAAADTGPTGARSLRVQRGDTLYGIVSRLYPEASRRDRWRLVEAMVAANRSVFPDGDPNRLPIGVELRVPDNLPGTPSARGAARTPLASRAESPADAGLRILSADEEEKLRSQGSPLAAAAAPVEAPAIPQTTGAPAASPPPAPAVATGSTANLAQEPAAAAQGPRIADLNDQLASAQARIRELGDKIARLDAQLGQTRATAVAVPAPPPAAPAAAAPAEPAESGFRAELWYPLGLLAIAGIPLAYLLGRSGRRRTEAVDDTLSLTVPTRSPTRAAPTAPILVPSEPSTVAPRAPGAANEPATPALSTPAFAPDLAAAPPSAPLAAHPGAAAAHLEDAHGPVHRLLLEAELHLLFDQREEARYVLEQAVDADSDERPDLRPWTMLFDLLRLTEDRESFERYTGRFQGRYNVAPPLWERPAEAEAGGGLAERFPHVMDRIIELWGTREGLRMLNALLLDDRGGSRRGFDFEIGEEISFLRDLLDRRGTDPVAAGPAGDDRWSTTTLNLAQ
jgi:Tfp pilus assembly protein FimV